MQSLPAPSGYVSDLAHVLNDDDKQQLEQFCTAVDEQLKVQFALVTVSSIGDTPIRDFALDVGRKWGVGSKNGNQGVVLVLAIQDHKSDIDAGRGIEPYITDGFAGDTLRAMRPQLRAGQYGQALQAAAQAMASQIAQGKNLAWTPPTGVVIETPRSQRGRDDGGGFPWPLLIFGIFFLLWLLGRGGRGGRGGPRYGGGGGGSGFLTGMILGNLLGGGGRRGGFGGGDWGGGGGGFGGDSGGGGGFGGFGGGDFGGGGASSDW